MRYICSRSNLSVTIHIRIPAGEKPDLRVLESALREQGIRDFSFPASAFRILKESIDARGKTIYRQYKVEVFENGEQAPEALPVLPSSLPAAGSGRVLVVGAGPAGLFAALRLLEKGFQPVVIERGKPVRERRRDLAAITRQQVVNPDSNYCFGEGGAGTYSDGKLYTRSDKRGDIQRILQVLVHFGADPSILTLSHPHIGTNKLPKIIENLRNYLLTNGAEVLFEHRLHHFYSDGPRIYAELMHTSSGETRTLTGDALVLATGHSASDIYHLLHKKNLELHSKPFALGVRIEHPQALIDRMQYHCHTEGERNKKREVLPAASYTWTEHAGNKSIYSFCMCPGGIIAPCATEPGEVVTNGWSPSGRNNPFANSGIVVSVDETDFAPYASYGPLQGLFYRREIERKAFLAAGSNLSAPAQGLLDFLQDKTSVQLPDCSYFPGITSVPLKDVLPAPVAEALKAGLAQQGKKNPLYLSREAVLVATESRTSTPVRIPRNKDSAQHPQEPLLYPCGEGAGYAGGIMSAAIDGTFVADCIVSKHTKQKR